MFKKIAYLASSLLCLFTFTCKSQNAAPANCMENPGGYGKMLVIIAQKINVENMPEEVSSMDGKYLATYKINEIVCGKYQRDTISFIAYDHYGYPAFSNYGNVMLFLSDCDSIIYHHKYQFFDLYKTRDGRWASSYKSDEYWRSNQVKPDSIDFAEEVSYNIVGGRKKLIKEYFPEPYYKITKEKAIAVWGNYVPELLRLKKDGVLKARGYYGDADSSFKIVETEMAEFANEFRDVTKKEQIALRDIFYQLRNAIKTKNTALIREMSLDTIYCSICDGIRDDYYDNELDNIQVYIDSAYQHFPNEKIWGSEDSRYELKYYADRYKKTKPLNFTLKKKEQLIIYGIYFFEMQGKTKKYIMPQSHRFQFVKINGDFKLYGMTSN